MSGRGVPGAIFGGAGIHVTPHCEILVIGADALIEPGPDFITELEGRVSNGETAFQLGEGDYEVPETVFAGFDPTLLENLRIRGLGWRRTRILGTFPGSVATSDVPSNTIFNFSGVATLDVNTTLAVTSMSDTDVITLTNPANVVPGMVLRIVGGAAVAGVSDALDMSDSAAVAARRTELVTILQNVAGNVFQITAPLHQWHGVGATVQSFEPVRGVQLEGMTLSGAGLAIACGFMFSGALDVSIADCAFEGFSRAGIDFEPGVKTWEWDAIRSLGELGSLWFCESALGGRIHNVNCKEDGLRAHGTGEPRPLGNFYGRCANIRCSDMTLQRGIGGIRRWGGWGLQFTNTNIRDMDADAIYTRSPLYAVPSALFGMAYDGGTGALGPLANAFGGFSAYGAEFAYNLSLGDWLISSCFADISHADGAYCILKHDVFHERWGNITIGNHGPGSGTVVNGRTVNMNGIVGADCFQGVIDKLDVSGCTRGWTCRATCGIQCAEYLYDGASGNTSAVIALLLDGGAGPRIRRMVMTGGGGIFAGPSWTFDPDFEIERLQQDSVGVWENVKQGANQTGGLFPITGSSLALAATGVRDIGAAAAASDRAVVAVAGQGNGVGAFCLIAPFGSVQAWGSVAGIGVAGDLIETNGAGAFAVNVLSAQPCGRLKRNKPLAAAAIVEIGEL